MGTNFLCIVSTHVEASKKTLREEVEDALFLAGGGQCLEMRMAHERRKVAQKKMGHRRRSHLR
jgi:hypothetical protein